jgi:F-type H+-transporting ATPase subunit delta
VAQYYTDTVKLYATALFNYALANKMLDKISEEILNLQSIYLDIETVAEPIYSGAEQIKLLQDISQSLKLSKETENLLNLLSKNKRLHLLEEIFKYFDILVSEYSGNKIVELIVSKELSLKEQDEVKQQLEDVLESKIQICLKIDPKIIGGVVVKVDNKMFDASLQSRFLYLSHAIKKQIDLI